MPVVTVLVPVYNGARYLSGTCASLLAQSFDDFEVLCIDDCSTDDSRSIIRSFAANDVRLRLISLPSNLGTVSRVLNIVLPNIASEYLVYSSQDDLHSPDWLSAMVQRARETGADAIHPEISFIDGPGRSERRIVGFKGDASIILSNRDAVVASLNWSITGFVLWRTALVQRIGFAEFCSSADEYTTRALFFACNEVAFSRGVFFSRQDNAEAVTKKLSYRLFDQPITQLRVLDLLRTNGFPADVLRCEMSHVIDIVSAALRLWLMMGHLLSPEHGRMARARLQQAIDVLRSKDFVAFAASHRGGLDAKRKVKLFVLRNLPSLLTPVTRVFRLTARTRG